MRLKNTCLERGLNLRCAECDMKKVFGSSLSHGFVARSFFQRENSRVVSAKSAEQVSLF